jgi:hypothetical protein
LSCVRAYDMVAQADPVYREFRTSPRHAADLVGLLGVAIRGELTLLTFPLGKPDPSTGSGPAWTGRVMRRPQPTRLQSRRRAMAAPDPDVGDNAVVFSWQSSLEESLCLGRTVV